MPTHLPRHRGPLSREGAARSRRWPPLFMLWILLAIIIAVVSSLIASYRRSPPPNSLSFGGITAPASPSFGGITAPASPDFGGIEVIDGDTIRRGGRVYRLVGFDTPETGRNARCERERTLGAAATRRLTGLLRGSGHVLTRVPCACHPGTEGTSACNYGRLCARLMVQGRDVGAILISEGLARSYVCGGTSCPPRAGWC